MPLLVSSTASVPPPPPPVVNPWQQLRMTWTGWDGSIWDLTDYSSGVLLTDGGLIGLHMPPGNAFTSSSPVVHGQRFRGWTAGARDIFWPLLVYGDSTDEWVSRDSALWASFSPWDYGTWTVYLPSGEQRSVRCRLADDGTGSYDIDPLAHGWGVYGVKMVADQPFWAGLPERRSWRPAISRPMFPQLGQKWALGISASGGLGNSTISNRGDVESYSLSTVTGPLLAATVVIAGSTIEVPFPLDAGEVVTLDARPDVLSATSSATGDRTDDLGVAEWAAVPPGASVPVAVTMDGGGDGASISIDVTPLFFRAIG